MYLEYDYMVILSPISYVLVLHWSTFSQQLINNVTRGMHYQKGSTLPAN